MKKNIITLALAGSCAMAVTAQPVITAADFDPTKINGYSFLHRSGNQVIEPGPEGANANWDLSAYNASTQFDYTVQKCPGGTDCGKVPEATEYLKSSLASVFFKKDADSWQQVGELSASNSLVRFSDPLKMLEFPVKFQETFSDNYASSSNQGSKTGSISSIIDGYGTLTTPSGTYTGVLRQKMVDEAATEASGATVNTTTTTYQWYKAGVHFPLATLIIMAFNIPEVPNYPKNYTLTYAKGSGTSLQNTKKSSVHLDIFPNPSDGRSLQISSAATRLQAVQLYDITGRSVYQQTIDPLKAGNNVQLQWDRALSKGIYLCTVTTAEGQFSQKIVVQ